jgi:hypothetical protein
MWSKFLVACSLVLGAGALGSGCASSDRSCPFDSITLDAGVDGLPDVGEYCSPEFCGSICPGAHTVCRREKEAVISCYRNCT